MVWMLAFGVLIGTIAAVIIAVCRLREWYKKRIRVPCSLLRVGSTLDDEA